MPQRAIQLCIPPGNTGILQGSYADLCQKFAKAHRVFSQQKGWRCRGSQSREAQTAGMHAAAATGDEKRLVCSDCPSIISREIFCATKGLCKRSISKTLSPAEGKPRQAMKKVLIHMIRFYQKRISTHTRSSCRFIPTCSEYAVTSIERYGAAKGLRLAIRRILRCNPFGKGGFDPVPENTDITIRRN